MRLSGCSLELATMFCSIPRSSSWAHLNMEAICILWLACRNYLGALIQAHRSPFWSCGGEQIRACSIPAVCFARQVPHLVHQTSRWFKDLFVVLLPVFVSFLDFSLHNHIQWGLTSWAAVECFACFLTPLPTETSFPCTCVLGSCTAHCKVFLFQKSSSKVRKSCK